MSALSRCLQEEAAAIKTAADRLNSSEVEKALQLLEQCSDQRAKLVITGVGKSGIVARKIAATFSSVGLMAIYLNPLDAMHGDLGVVAPEDLCMFISNSGQTEELVEVMNQLKRRGNSTIAMVGNQDSTLSRKSDIVLIASVDKELCPLNLAPTASTAVCMAIGDALATVWMDRRGVSTNDFAINHPAGSLGKRLTLTAGDIMIPENKLSSVEPNTPFEEVISVLTKDGIGTCWVEDPNCKGKLLGLITDGDLRRALRTFSKKEWTSLFAKEIMTSQPVIIEKDLLAIKALENMERNKEGRKVTVLPVVIRENYGNKLIGLLRLHDLIEMGLK